MIYIIYLYLGKEKGRQKGRGKGKGEGKGKEKGKIARVPSCQVGSTVIRDYTVPHRRVE